MNVYSRRLNHHLTESVLIEQLERRIKIKLRDINSIRKMLNKNHL